jgi:hypothetical protein
LHQAQRASQSLNKEYEEPFRVLPAVGAEHIIAQADGTMICTVEPGARKSPRPRQWKEMRLVGGASPRQRHDHLRGELWRCAGSWKTLGSLRPAGRLGTQ